MTPAHPPILAECLAAVGEHMGAAPYAADVALVLANVLAAYIEEYPSQNPGYRYRAGLPDGSFAWAATPRELAERILRGVEGAEKSSEPTVSATANDWKVAELEQACRDAVRDRELATALVAHPLMPGAAAQLIKLWRDELEVIEVSHEYKVRAKDGRSVTHFVGERLSYHQYSHFLLHQGRTTP